MKKHWEDIKDDIRKSGVDKFADTVPSEQAGVLLTGLTLSSRLTGAEYYALCKRLYLNATVHDPLYEGSKS
jgi:hypothetical protein